MSSHTPVTKKPSSPRPIVETLRALLSSRRSPFRDGRDEGDREMSLSSISISVAFEEGVALVGDGARIKVGDILAFALGAAVISRRVGVDVGFSVGAAVGAAVGGSAFDDRSAELCI